MQVTFRVRAHYRLCDWAAEEQQKVVSTSLKTKKNEMKSKSNTLHASLNSKCLKRSQGQNECRVYFLYIYLSSFTNLQYFDLKRTMFYVLWLSQWPWKWKTMHMQFCRQNFDYIHVRKCGYSFCKFGLQ